MTKNICAILFSFLLLVAFTYQPTLPTYKGIKQKGIHFFDSQKNSNTYKYQILQSTGIEWLTIVPYGFQEDYNSTVISCDSSGYQSWNTCDYQYIETIKKAKAAGFKIMLKPHLFLTNPTGKMWRAEVSQSSVNEWNEWSQAYTDFILHYAQMSEELDVELFCIGMELYEIVKQHPHFWKALIGQVRCSYSGEILYAANWYEEFERVDFWEDLDYIGIQGYFPLTNKKNPSIKELKNGWANVLPAIEAVARKTQKNVIFTEIGYKSTSDAAIEPWKWVEDQTENYALSYNTQANAYEAFFETFWNKSWFAGVHLWQWRIEKKQLHDLGFSPQDKPAEGILKKWFTKQ